MRTKWFLWRALGTLVVVALLAGLLIVGGTALYRASWSQGYTAGQLAAGDEESEVMPKTFPYMPYGFGYPGRHWGFPSFFFGLGLIFKIGLFFLLLAVIGRIIRWLVWGKVMMTGGPWPMGGHPYHRGRHWRRHHGPVPPWRWGLEEPSEEKTEETPDAAES